MAAVTLRAMISKTCMIDVDFSADWRYSRLSRVDGPGLAGGAEVTGDHAPGDPAGGTGAGGDGLRWNFELDVAAVFAALGREMPRFEDIEDHEADLADEVEARFGDGGAPSSADLGGAVAEALPAGPGLAAWLSGRDSTAATPR